jgi:hypothetical protein
LTPEEGRKFGLTVGGAFLVLSAVLWWRGKPGTAAVTCSLGSILFLAGLAVPGSLGPIYRAWMGLAHLMSKVTTPIFMGVTYFLVLTPVGLLMRALGKNPLVHRPQVRSNWYDRSTEQPEPSRMERQF